MSPTVFPQALPTSDDAQEVMTAYGIVRVPVDYFHWNGYRYTTLKDALAAAKRASPRGAADA